jgi:ferredoxin
MDAEVYYFSGTGNSLAGARDIAMKMNGKLIPIPAVVEKRRITTDAECIGIVFPAYMAHLYGVPLIVEKFAKKLENIGEKYVFAVCTCGGYELVNALPALRNLSQLIKSRGGVLSAEFSIRLPMNSLDYSHIPIPISKNQEAMFRNSKERIQAICRCIADRKRENWRTAKSIFNLFMTPLYWAIRNFYIIDLKKKSKEPMDTRLGFREMMPRTDKSIYAEDTCIGCGTCAKVCPVQNIEMVEGKPMWQHHCEMCLACDEWCPVRAIRHWCKVKGKDYRHPEVSLSDMIIR